MRKFLRKMYSFFTTRINTAFLKTRQVPCTVRLVPHTLKIFLKQNLFLENRWKTAFQIRNLYLVIFFSHLSLLILRISVYACV